MEIINEHSQTEPVDSKKSPKKRKRWWTRTKAILGHILPFLILGLIIGTIGYGIYLSFEDDPQSETSQTNVSRWVALVENWQEYKEQAKESNREILLNKFKISLCPFAEDLTTWDKSLSPEEAGMICGYVKVPLNHHNPRGRMIRIPVVIWPTEEETDHPDPLFIMQGGPGGSTLEMYPNWFYYSRPDEEREIVFVDQRGTRYAGPSLGCNDVYENEETDNAEESENIDDKENDDEYLTYLSACHDRLVSQGVDLNAYNTTAIAHDMEFIRQVFDYPTINFYGVSYGSHIAQYLAAYHPDGLRSLILDGVAPIPFNFLNQSHTHINHLLEVYLKECEEDNFCSANYPDLKNRINKIIDLLDENPVSITLKDPHNNQSIEQEITGKYFLYYLIYMLRMDSGYAILPYLVNQAEKGIFDHYISVSEMFAFDAGICDGIYYAVVWGEHAPLTVNDQTNYLIHKLSEIELESFEENQQEWEVWRISPSAEILSEMPLSSVPTLLLSGYYDLTTPPEYGETALESFTNGQHIIDPIGGHGIAFSDDCIIGIMRDFIDDPNEQVDSGCLSEEDRKYQLIPSDAISSPALRKAYYGDKDMAVFVILPMVVFLFMLFRSGFLHIQLLWKINRGFEPSAKARLNRLQLRFELSTWVFILCCLIYIICLIINIDFLSDNIEYLNAYAAPRNLRGFLLTAVFLPVVTLFIIFSAIKLWIIRKKIFYRTYLLFQVLLSSAVVGYLIWSGLLWDWTG